MSAERTAFAKMLLPIACALAAFCAAFGVGAQAGLRPIRSPMPGGSATPLKWLPPGASFPDTGPSSVIYPPQVVAIRFNHQKHVAMGSACIDCHEHAKTSTKTDDRLMPHPKICDACHTSDHSDLAQVKAGAEGLGTCEMCHQGYDPAKGNEVIRMKLPTARLRSNHKVHADRNINCEQCHGAVQEVELATREQLPRMKGCFGCHAMTGPGKGNAKNDCDVCHLTTQDKVMLTSFAEGQLLPPRWLWNMEHTPDFLVRHKRVAGDNAKACGSCHTEKFCTDCHDGRVRPRKVHPNDYISMHPVEARMDNPRCTSCHQEQTFCQPCHTRAGVTMSNSPANLRVKGRFHPPREIWSELPKTSKHHAWEAQRNLNACVSCHTERDCASCHATQALGGRGFNPHPPGFAARCATALRKNARPCLVCHETTSLGSLCK